jgi:hypothetical protein
MKSALLLVLASATCMAFGPPRQVGVSSLDDVVPQFVSGGGWSSTLTLINMEDAPIDVPIKFYDGDGQPWKAPLVGRDPVSSLMLTVQPKSTATLETSPAGLLQQGWVYLDLPCCPDLSGMAIFKQVVAGRPDFEAVVPLVSSYDDRTWLLFDNTKSFATGVAIVNPRDWSSATVTIHIRDENGQRILLDQFTVGPLKRQVFDLSTRFPQALNRKGSIEFTCSPGNLSVLGLRFNPGGAFTSVHSLEP